MALSWRSYFSAIIRHSWPVLGCSSYRVPATDEGVIASSNRKSHYPYFLVSSLPTLGCAMTAKEQLLRGDCGTRGPPPDDRLPQDPPDFSFLSEFRNESPASCRRCSSFCVQTQLQQAQGSVPLASR